MPPCGMCPTQFRHLWLSDLQRIVLNLENNCTIYTKAGGLTQQTCGSDKQYSTVGKGVIVIFVAHRLLGHEVSRCIHVCKYKFKMYIGVSKSLRMRHMYMNFHLFIIIAHVHIRN